MPEDDEYKNEPTYACRNCGRHFIKSSLEKHEPVCKKLSKLNRKPFDSGKQRATGSDLTIQDVRRAAKEKEKMGGQFPRPKTHWKQRHTDFIEAISASKKVDYALKTGAPLPPPPKTSVPSDYIECQYCGRSFNENAAERHIPFCKEQHMKKAAIVKTPAGRGLKSQMNSRGEIAATRDSSRTRQGRAESRIDTAATRRKSMETRGTTPSRSGSKSATHSHPVPPPSVAANRRSNSAPRNPTSHASRLKTPLPAVRPHK